MASFEDYWEVIVSEGEVSFKAIVTRSDYPGFRLFTLFEPGVVATLLAKGKKVVVEQHLVANRGKVLEYHAVPGFQGAVAWRLLWKDRLLNQVNPEQLNIQLAEIAELPNNPAPPE